MESELKEEFLPELFKACINKKEIFYTVKKHLKAQYLPEKSGFREVWKFLVSYHTSFDKMPTPGIINQQLSGDNEFTDQAIIEIKNIVKPDYDGLLTAFGDFIIQNRFVTLFDEVAEIYNKGNKELAFKKFHTGSDELSKISFKKALYDSVFSQFNKRFVERLFNSNQALEMYIPTGIDLLDHYMGGGMQRGEATLILGDSGTGKSMLLIYAGLSAAKRNFKVAHFQAEGKRQQVLDRYDAAWTGTLYREMKFSDIPAKKLTILKKRIKKFSTDIYVEARERFGSWSMVDIRNSLIELNKEQGKIDLIVIDYLDLIDPGDGRSYSPSEERFRQQAVAKLMKDIAVEFDAAVLTVTQASAVNPEAKQDPDFVLTRWNIAEDKGKIRPFDNFLTINQTRDEKFSKTARLFIDKLRENESDQIIHIAQSLARAKFYDRKRTLELYSEDVVEMLGVGQYYVT